MKRLSILLLILFVGACSNDDNTSSEAETGEESLDTETVESDEISELEKENESLKQELAQKEKEEAKKAESDSDGENSSESEESVNEEENEATEDTDAENETAAEENTLQEFTDAEKQEMNQLFYDWAVERAEIGGMAVTEMYFTHGAAGYGDWYAVTPDGEVQAQDLDNPGFDHFDIHAIGGVAFYQPESGDIGEDKNAPFPSTAEGYSRLAQPDTNVHKYMLADNGVVYELIGKKENISFSSGFGEYNDDGSRGEYVPDVAFEVSGDQDAQQEWQRILGMYQK